jgi:two-component system chemotaxis response regulator CheB
VEVAEEDRVLEQGTCYITPYQTGVSIARNVSGSPVLKLNGGKDAPLNRMFRSAARVFREKAIGLLLTGTGDDGAEGFASIREENGVTMALDTQCCVYPNLAHNAISKGTVDIVLDETGLPDAIEKLVG